MPFKRNSISEIAERILSDFQTRITGALSFFRRSTIKVIARVNAGAFHLVYEYLDYIAKQIFATTADDPAIETMASEYGISRTAATYATGTGTATGTDGNTIPAGTQLTSPTDQVYTVDSAVTISGGTATVNFTASIAGEDSNDDAGVLLSFVSPITGINSSITVDSSGISGGEDIETIEELRQRVLTRKRQPPHGGAYFDYEEWALEYPGVTRAWSYPQHMGIGTIGVSFVMDGQTNIFPTEVQRDAVRAYIVEHTDPNTGLTVGCPVTAEPGLIMIETIAKNVAFTIALSPNSATVRSNVQTAIEEVFEEKGEPEGTIYLSEISKAISLATGEVAHRIVSPTSDVTALYNEVPRVGTITFTDY